MRGLDITGKTFGRLTVLRRDYSAPSSKSAVWVCACSCGAECSVRSDMLRDGRAKSCGCFRRERASGLSKPSDLLGRRFGRLVAVEFAPKLKDRNNWYRCVCDCGAEYAARTSSLLTGLVVSCGCARIDKPGLSPRSARESRAVGSATRRARQRSLSGSITAAQVREVFRKQRGCCAWCGASLAGGFHRDHRVPLSAGGSNEIGNIDLLCAPCNLRKGSKDPLEWAAENGRLL